MGMAISSALRGSLKKSFIKSFGGIPPLETGSSGDTYSPGAGWIDDYTPFVQEIIHLLELDKEEVLFDVSYNPQIWLDVADISTITKDGSDYVSEQTNKGSFGSSATAVGAAPTGTPDYVADIGNGKPGLAYDGGPKSLTIGDPSGSSFNWLHSQTGASVMITASATTLSPASLRGLWGNSVASGSGRGQQWFLATSGGVINARIREPTGGQIGVIDFTGFTDTDPHIVSAIWKDEYDSGAGVVDGIAWSNGVYQASDTEITGAIDDPALDASTAIGLGRHRGDNDTLGWNGYIQEFIADDSAWTPAQHLQLANSRKIKWAIT